MILSTPCCWRGGTSSELAGQAFNIGGGPRQTVSLLEFMDLIGELCGEAPRARLG